MGSGLRVMSAQGLRGAAVAALGWAAAVATAEPGGVAVAPQSIAEQTPVEGRAAAPPPGDADQAKRSAQLGAMADGLSTYAALAAGGVERNPLLNSSPAGLLAATGLKLGLVEAIDAAGMPQEHKRSALRWLSTLWNAASLHNLAIAAGAATPLAVAVGLGSGVWMWRKSESGTAAGGSGAGGTGVAGTGAGKGAEGAAHLAARLEKPGPH